MAGNKSFSTISTSWVLDPNGCWRAASTNNTDGASAGWSYNFSGSDGFPNASQYSSGGTFISSGTDTVAASESAGFSYSNNATNSIDSSGSATLSGSGSGGNSASGTYTDDGNYPLTWINPPGDAAFSSDYHDTEGYSDSGSWNQAYNNANPPATQNKTAFTSTDDNDTSYWGGVYENSNTTTYDGTYTGEYAPPAFNWVDYGIIGSDQLTAPGLAYGSPMDGGFYGVGIGDGTPNTSAVNASILPDAGKG